MKSILQVASWMVLATATSSAAQAQISWAPDYPTACQAAADSNRLVLLHFYSDDCPPCRRVEAEVFTQPQVAAAVAKNYVPVKVHARQAPDLARRYQVDRWPTDVIVTPAGLEVQRATSPQAPEQYIAFVDAVATSSGTAARQWANNMQQVGQTTLNQTAATVNRYTAEGQRQWGQANAQLTQAQQQWGQAATQITAAADQTRQAGLQMSQQAQDAARQAGQQTQAAVQGFRQETQNAVNQYQQQAEGAAQFAQQQAGSAAQQWTNQITAAGQQFQQQAAATGNQFQAAVQPFGQQAAAPAVGQYGQYGQSVQPGVYDQNPPAAPAPAAAPNVPQQNPYTGAQFQAGSQAPPPGPQQQPIQPQFQPGFQPQPPPAPPSLVAASQAPPVAIDGYCPVTLLEKTASDSKDRTAWKKGDAKFGAIHLGRTYLFASEVEQKKFLANPDAYSPVLSGYDPVQYAIGGKLVEGKRSFGITYNRKLFLFADEASRDQFEKSPNAYAQPAYQAMQRGETNSTYR